MTTQNNSSHYINTRPRLRRKDVPEYLANKYGIDIAKATLAKLASIGGGPAMQYIGRIPLYHRDDLDAWAETKITNRVNSTSKYHNKNFLP